MKCLNEVLLKEIIGGNVESFFEEIVNEVELIEAEVTAELKGHHHALPIDPKVPAATLLVAPVDLNTTVVAQ
jgi:hypothetical protein